jgi:hypothetical protein
VRERSTGAGNGSGSAEWKPPYVHVAEAVGWTQCVGTTLEDWTGVRPGGGTAEMIPRFDLYDDMLDNAVRQLGLKVSRQDLEASVEFADQTYSAVGETPELAVCNLIRELRRAGRLRR